MKIKILINGVGRIGKAILKILMKISLQNEKKTSTKIGSFIVVIVIGIEFTNRFTIR